MDRGVLDVADMKVVFFASLKETLNRDSVDVQLDSSLTVADLKHYLAEHLQQPVLLDKTVKAAIDFDFARETDVIDPARVKEVAFFPPVTGG